jgi:hypothetical protein
MLTRERWRRRFTEARTTIGRRSQAGRAAIGGAVGLDEILLAAALLLIGAGLWQAWRPGALLVPGAVLLWLTLPTRAAFFRRSTHTPPVPERRKPWAS